MLRDRPVIEAISSPSAEFPSRTRSAVTNHKDLLPGLDGRSATARRFRDLVNAFAADMSGLDHCSEIPADAAGLALVVFTSGTLTARSFAPTSPLHFHRALS